MRARSTVRGYGVALVVFAAFTLACRRESPRTADSAPLAASATTASEPHGTSPTRAASPGPAVSVSGNVIDSELGPMTSSSSTSGAPAAGVTALPSNNPQAEPGAEPASPTAESSGAGKAPPDQNNRDRVSPPAAGEPDGGVQQPRRSSPNSARTRPAPNSNPFGNAPAPDWQTGGSVAGAQPASGPSVSGVTDTGGRPCGGNGSPGTSDTAALGPCVSSPGVNDTGRVSSGGKTRRLTNLVAPSNPKAAVQHGPPTSGGAVGRQPPSASAPARRLQQAKSAAPAKGEPAPRVPAVRRPAARDTTTRKP